MLNFQEGKANGLVCPKCGGGAQKEPSLSVRWSKKHVQFRCFRAHKCGWHGYFKANDGPESDDSYEANIEAIATGYKVDQQDANFVYYDGTNKKQIKRVQEIQNQFKEYYVDRQSSSLPSKKSDKKVKLATFVRPLGDKVIDWFKARGISQQTLSQAGVMQREKDGQQILQIAFCYSFINHCVFIKYRNLEQKYFETEGKDKVLYCADNLILSDQMVVVEGEIDALSLLEAGVQGAVSVPFGASGGTYIEAFKNMHHLIKDKKQVLIMTDNDPAGEKLADTLYNYFKDLTLAAKVQRVRLPNNWGDWTDQAEALRGTDNLKEMDDFGGRKDANEMLVKDGPKALEYFVQKAIQDAPLEGIVQLHEVQDQIVEDLVNPQASCGKFTGWSSLQPYYCVRKGEVTVVTGYPNHGKSEWVDALMVNLAAQYGGKFGVCSFENEVGMHTLKLVEKFGQLPLLCHMRGGKRMDPAVLLDVKDQFSRAFAQVNKHFVFLKPQPHEQPTIAWLSKVITNAAEFLKVEGIVIDPYNRLEIDESRGQTETQQIGDLLKMLTNAAKRYQIHIWVVAHPKARLSSDSTKQRATPYLISGSANWYNQADNVIVVERKKSKNYVESTDIHVDKVRNTQTGSIGRVNLIFRPEVGVYHVQEEPYSNIPAECSTTDPEVEAMVAQGVEDVCDKVTKKSTPVPHLSN